VTERSELPLTESTTTGACGCGCTEEAAAPVLDARAIPHAIRHGAIFGALGTVPVGGALVLVAPHDPLPLLAQIAERERGAIAVSYLQRGPDAWRLQLLRTR
jgi:uncharacterized protein (DUF2249 family)